MSTKLAQTKLGVGDGDGQLFVYGDHNSIKECQRKLIEREEFRRRAELAEDLAYMHKATDKAAARTWQQQAEFLKKILLDENAAKAKVEAKVQSLEKLRPVWAQGLSDDSIAAQVSSLALANIWKHLGVDNQDAAMQKLKALLPEPQPGDLLESNSDASPYRRQKPGGHR